MKNALIVIGLCSMLFGCKKSLYDSEYVKLNHDGEKRSYLLHVPDSYDDGIATSLIVALHGGVGSAKNIEEQSGLAEYSDEVGFILCSPNGLNRAWNSGWCCGKSAKNNVDDVGFISKVIDDLLAEYNIDPSRVYVTGMSNGAMMSYRLACEISDKIAAIAPVAGTMVTNDCQPENPVSVIAFHSYKDINVPHEGGVGDGISDHYNSPQDSVYKAWGSINNCAVATTTEITEGVDFMSMTSCSDSTEVHWYFTNDGGHSWPGGTAPTRKADEPSKLIEANEIMWEFFQSHPKR